MLLQLTVKMQETRQLEIMLETAVGTTDHSRTVYYNSNEIYFIRVIRILQYNDLSIISLNSIPPFTIDPVLSILLNLCTHFFHLCNYN